MNTAIANATGLLLACALGALAPVTCASTLERVRTSNTFTMGYQPDLAPFSAQEGDKASGYAIDLCLKVADTLKNSPGLADVQLHYQPVLPADQLRAVSAGTVDILCTPTQPTLERRKTVSYSLPVYTAGLSVMVRKDAAETLVNVLSGKLAHTGPTWRATINRGLANHTYATIAQGEAWVRQQMHQLGVLASLTVVSSTVEGARLVAEGKVDAFFSERMLLNNEIAKVGADTNLMVLERIFEYAPMAMMVDRNDEDFRLLVDTALSDAYRSGDVALGYEKYLGGASDSVKRLFKVYALP